MTSEPPYAPPAVTPSTRAPAGATQRARRRGRAPGRPAGEGAELRQRLLDAAVERFALQGIAGTTLRDIAAAAGVTPALVHYYFGNRDAVQAAVIEERLLPIMRQMQASLMLAGDDPRALIRGFVRGMLTTAMAHPWLPQLWVREILHAGGALRDVLFERISVLPKLLVQRFAALQAQGRLNPRIDPRLLVPSLMGQTMFMAASAPIWRELLDAREIDADALASHVLALLEHGLELHDE